MDITVILFTLCLQAMDLHTGMDHPLAMDLDRPLVMEMDMVLGTALALLRDMVTDLLMGTDLHLRVTTARDPTLLWIIRGMSKIMVFEFFFSSFILRIWLKCVILSVDG